MRGPVVLVASSMWIACAVIGAYLPPELHESAAIANLLLLKNPGILPASHSRKGLRDDLVTSAAPASTTSGASARKSRSPATRPMATGARG